MDQIAAWVLLGLIAGAIARGLVPGQSRGGWLSALVIGIAGALLGGWIGRQFGYLPPADPGEWLPSLKSVLTATVGAIVVLSIWNWIKS